VGCRVHKNANRRGELNLLKHRGVLDHETALSVLEYRSMCFLPREGVDDSRSGAEVPVAAPLAELTINIPPWSVSIRYFSLSSRLVTRLLWISCISQPHCAGRLHECIDTHWQYMDFANALVLRQQYILTNWVQHLPFSSVILIFIPSLLYLFQGVFYGTECTQPHFVPVPFDIRTKFQRQSPLFATQSTARLYAAFSSRSQI
jgi:hypothetical protein